MSAALPIRVVYAGTDWPAWLTATGTMLSFLVLAVTAGFALNALHDAKTTRHGLLITEIQRQWSGQAVVTAIAKLADFEQHELTAIVCAVWDPTSPKPTPEQRQSWDDLAPLANQIEQMGVLVSEDAITDDVVYLMWGGAILGAWDKWEPSIKNLRIYDGQPDTFRYFEKLAISIQAINRGRLRELARRDANDASSAGGPPGTTV